MITFFTNTWGQQIQISKIIVKRNGNIVWNYVENQAILEPILLYRVFSTFSKEQGSEDCLCTHIFTFLCDYYQCFSFFCQNANIT